MGTKISKEKDQNSPSTYENVLRAYAKWDYHSALTSHDINRSSSQEIKNFKRHKQISQNSPNQQKRNSSKEPSLTKKSRYEKNLLTKSQSADRLSSSKNLITTGQLIKNQSQQRQRYRSTPSQSSNDLLHNQNFSSTTNINSSTSSKHKTKQIPNDSQLVLINPHDLQNAHKIGKGNFGTVYLALYKGTRDVALKTLNSPERDYPNGLKCSIEEYDGNMHELLYEAHIMTQLQHANLLRIIGVTFFGREKELSLVTDFMKNGSLLDYLRKHRDIFNKSDSKEITSKLNHFSKQIFQAMLYLEERSIIHRDLAARNCLIGDEDVLKVADFGLTKLTECGLYKGTYRTRFAIRWTSPEAIFFSKYTSRSDVWSYGITLWEIYSLGERPYGILDNKTVKNLLKNSSENLKHYLPQSHQFGSDEVYTHLISPCLTYNAALRPRFKDLIERVFTIFNDKIQ